MKHKIFFGSFPNHAAEHGHQVSHKLVEFVEYVIFSSFICLSICSTVVLWGTTFCSFVYLHIWEKDNRPHLKWKEKFHIPFSSKLFTHIYDNVISKEQLCIQLEKYKCLRFILILFHFCYMIFLYYYFLIKYMLFFFITTMNLQYSQFQIWLFMDIYLSSPLYLFLYIFVIKIMYSIIQNIYYLITPHHSKRWFLLVSIDICLVLYIYIFQSFKIRDCSFMNSKRQRQVFIEFEETLQCVKLREHGVFQKPHHELRTVGSWL